MDVIKSKDMSLYNKDEKRNVKIEGTVKNVNIKIHFVESTFLDFRFYEGLEKTHFCITSNNVKSKSVNPVSYITFIRL